MQEANVPASITHYASTIATFLNPIYNVQNIYNIYTIYARSQCASR